VLVALGGCAGTPGLDVGYPEAGANPALLASVAPRTVGIGAVVDRRVDTARIGSGPGKTRNLVTSRPVPEIVRDALAVELGRNGLTASGGGDTVLRADVEEFWLDIVAGYPGAQYVGRVAIAIAVSDGRTGEALLTRRYVGIRRQRVDEESESARRDVMNIALARTMRDLATDPALASALASVSSPR
jgi:hypothetical protein